VETWFDPSMDDKTGLVVIGLAPLDLDGATTLIGK
jgi:hypothetical protein